MQDGVSNTCNPELIIDNIWGSQLVRALPTALPQQVIVHFGCFQWLPALVTGSYDVTSCSRVLDDIM